MRTICTIKSSGLRLLNLINDILDAASMQHVSEHELWHAMTCSALSGPS